MSGMGVELLIERVYDLALDPEQWPTLISEVASSFGGHAASLEQEFIEPIDGNGVVHGLDPAVVRQYFDYYAARNVLRRDARFGEALKTFIPIITVDEDSMAKQSLMRTEFYADFMRPAGMHSIMTFGLWGRADSVTALSTSIRGVNRPSFDEADRIRADYRHPHPHARLCPAPAGRRGGGCLSDMAEALDHSPHGVILISGGKVRHANAKARQLFAEPGGLGVMGGALVAGDVADTERLRWLIGCAQRRRGPGRRRNDRSPAGRPANSSPLVASPLGPEAISIVRGEPAVLIYVANPAAVTISDAYLRASEIRTDGGRSAAGPVTGRRQDPPAGRSGTRRRLFDRSQPASEHLREDRRQSSGGVGRHADAPPHDPGGIDPPALSARTSPPSAAAARRRPNRRIGPSPKRHGCGRP